MVLEDSVTIVRKIEMGPDTQDYKRKVRIRAYGKEWPILCCQDQKSRSMGKKKGHEGESIT